MGYIGTEEGLARGKATIISRSNDMWEWKAGNRGGGAPSTLSRSLVCQHYYEAAQPQEPTS
jgi:hypothetical protein